MNAGARLAGFGVGLAALFVAGLGAGAVVGDDEQAASSMGGMEMEGMEMEGMDVSGLSSFGDGFSFVPAATELQPGQPGDFRFQVVGPDGRPVQAYRPQHERELHLIVASRDLGWFTHIHPVRDAEGTWSVPLTLPRPGPYRAFADFAVAGGGAYTLGVDLTAPGAYQARPLPAPSTMSMVGDYHVTLAGAPTSPGEADLRLTVNLGGRPVTDLDPYLGAYGHVVALREGDLAYIHVHPEGVPGDGSTTAGPEVRFGIHLPTAARYRLFFDFSHRGTVRTADFTVAATGGTTSPGGPHGPGHG